MLKKIESRDVATGGLRRQEPLTKFNESLCQHMNFSNSYAPSALL